MSKYTSDDNRSMQLNDNNDRYYDSRGIDRYDDSDDGEMVSSWRGDVSSQVQASFERRQHLREYSCPVGCHEQSNYYPDQYHQHECEHQKAHRERPRLLKEYMWTLDHIRELKSKGERTTYWENQADYVQQQLQRSLDLWREEITAEKARSKAMPHIYG